MNQQSSDNPDAECFNEELREYEGFSAILSEVKRAAASDPGAQPDPQLSELDSVRAALMPTTDEEHAAQRMALEAMMADKELAELVQPFEALLEARRSKAVSDLFPSSQTASSDQE